MSPDPFHRLRGILRRAVAKGAEVTVSAKLLARLLERHDALAEEVDELRAVARPCERRGDRGRPCGAPSVVMHDLHGGWPDLGPMLIPVCRACAEALLVARHAR